MNDMLNTLEGFDSGSNYKFGNKMEKASCPRSLFDLSHLNTMTIDNAGLLIPIALMETLPSDDFDINVDCLLRVMPQVVPLYSRQRLFIYGFWSRYSDLWNNWQVFMDKGYTGNVQKSIPVLKTGKNASYASGKTVLPNSLFDYLGCPIGTTLDNMFKATGGANISALPWMMYLRIYRDYFMNKNEWINDRVILPDDDSRFRLDDDGQLLSAKDNSKVFNLACDDTHAEDLSVSGNNYYMGLLYHDYPDDYFTSALPFTQRGTAPSLPTTLDLSNVGLDFSQSNFYAYNDGNNNLDVYASSSSSATVPLYLPVGTSATITGENNTKWRNQLARGKLTNTTVSTGILLEDIRRLAVQQIELERLARTDGSYKQFGLSFFGESSKASYDFRPYYIGGTYKNIAFTEVIQNAPAAAGQTPLGTYAGHGITGISNGRIGHIHCDDYGLIMLVACIMPDVYYSQGLDRVLTDSLQSDKWLPERVKLGMQPIYNKELYYAGNNGSSSGQDNYLWAYQNPFDYLRYMPNKIHGKIADSSNNTFFPYTQSRNFNALPNWGRSFSEAKDVRKSYLFAPTENAYSAQFGINIRAVRPLPYKAIPAEIIN